MNVKALVCKAITKASDVYEKNKLKVAGIASAGIITCSNFLVGASAAEDVTSTISTDLVTAMSSVDYSVVLTCVVSLVPAVFPAVFGLIAVRKGIGFVLGLVRGA